MKRDLKSTRNVKIFTDLNLKKIRLRLLKRHRSHDIVNMADRVPTQRDLAVEYVLFQRSLSKTYLLKLSSLPTH